MFGGFIIINRLKIVLAVLVLSLSSQLAYAFQLQSMDARRVNLMDYIANDRWTLLMFWATDCVACEEQKPALEAFYRLHRDGLATVVGVATDGVEFIDEINKLNELHNPSYPNLMAFSDVFHRQYKQMSGKDFRVTPTFIIFDANGKLYGAVYGYLNFADLQQHIAAGG